MIRDTLNCFGGLQADRVAFDRIGLTIQGKHYCSEIDPYAIKIGQKNYPDTIQVGDISKLDPKDFPNVDLLLAGSPCQGFSFAGKQLNFDDPRSKLFFEFVRLIKGIKPKFVLLENVRMKKESENIITHHMGFLPQAKNSKWLSPQNRNRLYWFGELIDGKYRAIQIPPMEDKNIVLADILEDLPFDDAPNYLKGTWCGRVRGDMVKSVDDDKAHCLTASMWKGQIPTFVKSKNPIHVGNANDIKGYDIIKRVYSPQGKSPTLTTMQGGHRQPKVAIGRLVNRRLDEHGVRKDNQLELPLTTQLEVGSHEKSNCLTTVQKDNVVVSDYKYRKLTPLECERLQTLPDNYTEGVSNTQRYKMIGNGWTVDVISHILGEMLLPRQYL